ncbi:MAG: aminotransferase class V-fold PLP-dependent enzyme [Candidatus Thermoplasmatota archaeon]|nr:aminotransferase class V-fold PLP-dependent enzyme [Candidatus Thermoplasmatota archaeon]
MLSPLQIKKDFPIFERLGPDYSYLDNAATSQKPYSVIRAMEEFYELHNSNVHRGIYRLSEEATNLYEKSREKVSDFINSKDSRQIVFVRNTTEAINLLSYTLGRELKKDDEILITILEHHSNIVPWQFLSEKGVKLRYVMLNPDMTLDMDDLQRKLTKKTRIVSIAQSSNVLGTISDVKEIGKIAHENGSTFVVDAAQSVPHMPVDATDIDADFLAFSGHKMLGPTGIGVLYGKYDLLDRMPPFMGGGEMISAVYQDHSTYADVPQKYEAGTPNIEGAVGLSSAVDYLRALGMDQVREHEKDLIEYTLKKEEEHNVPDLISYGPRNTEVRSGVYCFNIGEMSPLNINDLAHEEGVQMSQAIHPHDVSEMLDDGNVAVRSGHHCAMPLAEFLNVVATSRASYYIYNTREDVDRLFNVLVKVVKKYGR